MPKSQWIMTYKISAIWLRGHKASAMSVMHPSKYGTEEVKNTLRSGFRAF